MPFTENNQMTPREWQMMEAERDEARLSREHAITIKKLELELQRQKDLSKSAVKELELAVASENNQREVEIKRLEIQWYSLLSLPKKLLLLPVYAILSVGYIIVCIRGVEPTERFWNLINK